MPDLSGDSLESRNASLSVRPPEVVMIRLESADREPLGLISELNYLAGLKQPLVERRGSGKGDALDAREKRARFMDSGSVGRWRHLAERSLTAALLFTLFSINLLAAKYLADRLLSCSKISQLSQKR